MHVRSGHMLGCRRPRALMPRGPSHLIGREIAARRPLFQITAVFMAHEHLGCAPGAAILAREIDRDTDGLSFFRVSVRVTAAASDDVPASLLPQDHIAGMV